MKSDVIKKFLSTGDMKYSYLELAKKSVIVFLVTFLLGAVAAFLFVIKDLFI